jgi:hypothetical protein
LLDDFFGRVKWGAYSKAAKNLVPDKLAREQRKAAALPESEYLSLRPAGPPAETGKVVKFRAA